MNTGRFLGFGKDIAVCMYGGILFRKDIFHDSERIPIYQSSLSIVLVYNKLTTTILVHK